jgi:hypothetical protein
MPALLNMPRPWLQKLENASCRDAGAAGPANVDLNNTSVFSGERERALGCQMNAHDSEKVVGSGQEPAAELATLY